MTPDLTSHRNPSAGLAAALDRAPACQCIVCVHRRESQIRERLVQEAREMERVGAA